MNETTPPIALVVTISLLGIAILINWVILLTESNGGFIILAIIISALFGAAIGNCLHRRAK